MNINKLDENFITLTMNYEEVRDITNGLYHAVKYIDSEKYKAALAKMSFVRDMI